MHLYCIVEEGLEQAGPCKIGVASSLSKRISSLQGGNYRRLSFAWFLEFKSRESALQVEQFILGRLRPCEYTLNDKTRLCSEWVEATPRAALDLAQRLRASLGEDE